MWKRFPLLKKWTIFHFFQIESTDVPLYLRMSLKGILSWSANFSYVRELILPSSKTYFVSKSEVSLPLNQAKTENPGTSSALKSGYPEEYRALKIGYPEEHVTLKSGYRKRLLHWKVATGRSCYIENWLPGKESSNHKTGFSVEMCVTVELMSGKIKANKVCF